MNNAQLVGLSRQVVLRRQLDMVANNLANLNTNGYKAQSLLMKQTDDSAASAETFLRPDRPVNFVVDDANVYDFRPGRIEETGDQFDLALQGDAWFSVETPDGERFTRNGSFALNATGELVDRDGHRVQTDGGPLTFTPDETKVTFAADGTVSTANGIKGRLKLSTFASKGDLTKVGETLFSGANPEPATFPRLVQGSIERSNVRSVVEMARMVQITRTYESVSNFLSSTDQLSSDAINALGQVS
jgi:flagellar basal-body rod protein FlgF